jgi:hypothetical protein
MHYFVVGEVMLMVYGKYKPYEMKYENIESTAIMSQGTKKMGNVRIM